MGNCARRLYQEVGSTKGYAFTELLTVLALTGFFACALLQTTLGLQRCLNHWEQSARMRQTLAAVLFIVSRDVRMAGCNPTGEARFEPVELNGGAGTEPRTVQIRMDKRGSKVGSRPDGDIEDPDEVIFYRWDDIQEVLRRNNQPLAARIVPNPGGVTAFDLIEETPQGLMRVCVTTGTPDGGLSLSTSVFIRNPL